MYLTIVVISLIQIGYIIIGYTIDNWISESGSLQILTAILVGGVIGGGNFIYQVLIPLKLAREFTDKMVKRNGDNSASYVGTIIGTTLGVVSLLNTVLFSNLTTLVDKITSNETVAITFLILILVLSNGVLFKGIKKDLMTYKCIAKRFPRKIKSRNYKAEDQSNF